MRNCRSEYMKTYREIYGDKMNLQISSWHQKNPEYNRQWRMRHKNYALDCLRKWRLRNREKFNRYMKQYMREYRLKLTLNVNLS